MLVNLNVTSTVFLKMKIELEVQYKVSMSSIDVNKRDWKNMCQEGMAKLCKKNLDYIYVICNKNQIVYYQR